MEPSAEPPGRHAMQCMEIWGGSNAVEKTITTPGLDGWVFSKPHEGADSGGDVHYVSLCGGGVITRLIVADVSGHGSAVAEFSHSLRSLMRRNINSKSQTRLVRALNQQFAELAQMRRFATAVVATYLATHDRLTVCNAGHPNPLWYRAATREWKLLVPSADKVRTGGSNLPLGLDDDTPYNQFTVKLDAGDIVFFYTDALIEASDEGGHLIGEEGLLAIARGVPASEPRTIGLALLDGVERYRGGLPADDDVTLLMLHHNASHPPRLSLATKLDVYAKVFGLKTV